MPVEPGLLTLTAALLSAALLVWRRRSQAALEALATATQHADSMPGLGDLPPAGGGAPGQGQEGSPGPAPQPPEVRSEVRDLFEAEPLLSPRARRPRIWERLREMVGSGSAVDDAAGARPLAGAEDHAALTPRPLMPEADAAEDAFLAGTYSMSADVTLRSPRVPLERTDAAPHAPSRGSEGGPGPHETGRSERDRFGSPGKDPADDRGRLREVSRVLERMLEREVAAVREEEARLRTSLTSERDALKLLTAALGEKLARLELDLERGREASGRSAELRAELEAERVRRGRAEAELAGAREELERFRLRQASDVAREVAAALAQLRLELDRERAVGAELRTLLTSANQVRDELETTTHEMLVRLEEQGSLLDQVTAEHQRARAELSSGIERELRLRRELDLERSRWAELEGAFLDPLPLPHPRGAREGSGTPAPGAVTARS